MNLYDFLQKIKNFKPSISFDTIKNNIVPLYAKSLSDFQFLSHGNFGSTFFHNNIVIKITTDHCEVKIAKQLVDQTCENLADIYNVFTISEKYSIIIQEKLDTQNKEFNDAVDYIFGILEERLLTLPELMEEFSENEIIKDGLFLNHWCPELSIQLIKSAYKASNEVYNRTGFPANDFNLSNFGLKNNIVAAFDHTII